MSLGRLEPLVSRIAEDGAVTGEEAMALRQQVFPDGRVDRSEAEGLFALGARMTHTDAAFVAMLFEAIGDHVLQDHRQITDADGEWLVRRAQTLAPMQRCALLVDVLRRADSAPLALAQAARAAVLARLSGAALARADVEEVRTLLHAGAACGAAHITQEELAFLFALDAACDGLVHDPSWPDLFVRAALNHLMGQRRSHLLDRDALAQRRVWLEADTPFSPGAFFARMLEGGFAGWRDRLQTPSMLDQFEQHYEQRNAEAEEDARLTLQEVTALVAMVRADAKRTANEEALLAEVRRIEAAQRSPRD